MHLIRIRRIRMDLNKIVNGCKSAEPDCIKALYDLYSDMLMRQCLLYVKSKDAAYDLFHDAFLIIISKIGQLRDPMKLNAWMTSIVRNLAIQYLRDRNKYVSEKEMTEAADEDVVPAYQPVPVEVLISMIDRLPEQYGKVFRMSVLDGLTHKEIGRILGIEERTSSSNLFRARIILKEAIRKYWSGILVFIFVAMLPFILNDQEQKTGPASELTHTIEAADSTVVIDPVLTEYYRQTIKPLIAEKPETAVIADRDSIIKQADSEYVRQDTASTQSKALNKNKDEERQYFAWENIDWDKDAKRTYRRKAAIRVQFSNMPGSISTNHPMNPGNGLLADVLPKNDFISTDTKIESWSDLERILADLAQNYPDSVMYSSLHAIATGNAAVEGNEMKEEREYARPLTFGITTSIELDRKWSLITGLEYSRLSSRAHSGIDTVSVSNRQKIHYLGLPIGASYSVWNRDKLTLSLSAYGRIDIPLAGSSIIEHHNGNIITYNDRSTLKAPVQWSVGTGICFQYMLGKNTSIYLEPQLQYHFDTEGDVSTVWTERPVDFSIPIGIRFYW